ncbi:MAG: hypothetical protein ACSLE0_06595 [Chitinophagaceae bacterium]
MKKTISASLVLAALAFTISASAQSYKTGIGVRLSSAPAMVNNSISLKHFMNEKAAVEVLFSFGDPLSIGALYEVHKPFSSEGLQWFYGGGGYLGFVKSWNPNKNKNETDVNIGAQGVVGLDYKFVNLPLNLSLDWKPELNLVSDINFEPAAIGFTARFTF